jgi:hypothetical protein
MDESAVHGWLLFQWLQSFLEILHQRFSRSAANTRLCRVLGRLLNAVLWVCDVVDVAVAFLPLHWDHHIATVLQSYFADVAKARVLKELGEFRVPQGSLTQLHLVL